MRQMIDEMEQSAAAAIDQFRIGFTALRGATRNAKALVESFQMLKEDVNVQQEGSIQQTDIDGSDQEGSQQHVTHAVASCQRNDATASSTSPTDACGRQHDVTHAVTTGHASSTSCQEDSQKELPIKELPQEDSQHAMLMPGFWHKRPNSGRWMYTPFGDGAQHVSNDVGCGNIMPKKKPRPTADQQQTNCPPADQQPTNSRPADQQPTNSRPTAVKSKPSEPIPPWRVERAFFGPFSRDRSRSRDRFDAD